MTELRAPNGIIKMRIDGTFVDFEPIPIKSNYDVDANYKILIDFVPDGQEHQIACCFIPDDGVWGFGNSGERYQAIDFSDGAESSLTTIGLVCNDSYDYDDADNLQCDYESFDFDMDYSIELETSFFINTYEIKSFTQTRRFVIGIAWLTGNVTDKRKTDCWFAAEPSLKDFVNVGPKDRNSNMRTIIKY